MSAIKKRSGDDLADTRIAQDMTKFLTDCCYIEQDEGVKFDRVVVKHLVQGNKVGDEVCHYRVPKQLTDNWAESTALDILSKLHMEAMALTGWQKWSVYVYTNNDTVQHFGRHLVKLQTANEHAAIDELDTEGPNALGISHQQMRHTEAMAKTVVALTGGIGNAYNSIIARQAEMIDRMSESHIEVLTTLKDLTADKRAQDMEVYDKELKAEAFKKGIEKLSVLAPVLINKIAGKQIIPVAQEGMMMQARSLFGAITASDQKMQALAAILSPEEMASFLTLYDSIAKASMEGESEVQAPAKVNLRPVG